MEDAIQLGNIDKGVKCSESKQNAPDEQDVRLFIA
jgi:hypothetical protein